ncbi:sigma-70 family RNA polymerase sigma factor [Chakrabartyella piscis]|uniref:sigma-70 family RNA polymerase sigma factor n=1 Tax=Chakrabartyella piscis TaxID=2918914 RepID=UPI002958DBD7|nr:sigma-70 family RNA polymerase sigma factor [Chakrabartyella piscis]
MEHTKRLIEQAQQGKPEAKETLIVENSGLVWRVVHRFQGRGVESEDLYQIGNIGLLKCIERFDFSYDVKFSTYAVPMIIGEIQRFLRDDGKIKVSRSLKELAQKAKIVEEKLQYEWNREVTVAELAKELQVDLDILIPALESRRDVESLNAPISADGEGTLEQLIVQKNEEDQLCNHLHLKEVIGNLDEMEKQLIWMRYFKEYTQREVAEVLNISQVQVSRIEKRILLGMRTHMNC